MNKSEIIIQVCSYCRGIEAILEFQPNSKAPPITPDWAEYIENVEDFIIHMDPQQYSIEYIGYCCIECEIEDKGWAE